MKRVMNANNEMMRVSEMQPKVVAVRWEVLSQGYTMLAGEDTWESIAWLISLGRAGIEELCNADNVASDRIQYASRPWVVEERLAVCRACWRQAK
jgi:hypothetical protein